MSEQDKNKPTHAFQAWISKKEYEDILKAIKKIGVTRRAFLKEALKNLKSK